MEPGNRFFTKPSIYIEETSQAFRIIEPFPETMAVFIGYTQSGADHLLQPVSISSLQDYTTTFGEAGQTTMQVDLTTDEPPQILSMTIAAIPFPLLYHIQLYFANGGRKCWVISIGNDYTQKSLGTPGENPSGFLGGLQVAEMIKDANLLVIPEGTGLSRPDYSILIQAMLAHSARSSNRFALIDVHGANELVADTLEQHRLAVGSEHLRYGASYFPYVIANYIPQIDPSDISYNEPGYSDRQPKLLMDHPFVNELTAAIRTWLNDQFLVLPPSAAVAGAIARVDRERGTWKSPANITIEDVQSPAVILNEQQQQAFNVDTVSGISINVIRIFQGRGTLIWGARTMQGNNAEWRYIAVQRFVGAVEAAVQKALAPFIFEPNESSAWIKIQTLIENFLVQQWKQGALQGMTTKEAFFVHVGPGQTMTQEDVVQGRMIVEVGMALLRPAEFTILRFHQQTRV